MKTKVLTRVTMMVALMIVSGVLTIPLPGLPVPIVLQNMMMMLAGGLLGKKFGTLAVSVFLLMVAVGFPVLSGGRGGEYCEQIEPPVRMIEPASAINRATQCNRESH